MDVSNATGISTDRLSRAERELVVLDETERGLLRNFLLSRLRDEDLPTNGLRLE